MRVTSKCKSCGKLDEFDVPDSGFRLRSRGATLAKAYPELPASRIRQLAEHLCPNCQEKEVE